MITYDDNIWWSYMMITYDDHTWWSYMMIIYDDHIWCSYMMSIYDDHIWWSSGSHLGVIWGSSGRHLGVIWDPFGTHLGAIWEPFGIHLETSGRMEAEEASGGQISDYLTPSATECKRSIKFSISRWFFEGTINYECIFTATYAADLRERFAGPLQGPLPRPWEPH